MSYYKTKAGLRYYVPAYLNVGTPLSALIPAPDRATMWRALERSSRNICMSLEGPLALSISQTV